MFSIQNQLIALATQAPATLIFTAITFVAALAHGFVTLVLKRIPQGLFIFTLTTVGFFTWIALLPLWHSLLVNDDAVLYYWIGLVAYMFLICGIRRTRIENKGIIFPDFSDDEIWIRWFNPFAND